MLSSLSCLGRLLASAAVVIALVLRTGDTCGEALRAVKALDKELNMDGKSEEEGGEGMGECGCGGGGGGWGCERCSSEDMIAVCYVFVLLLLLLGGVMV